MSSSERSACHGDLGGEGGGGGGGGGGGAPQSSQAEEVFQGGGELDLDHGAPLGGEVGFRWFLASLALGRSA